MHVAYDIWRTDKNVSAGLSVTGREKWWSRGTQRVSFPSLLCTLKGRLANWMMLVFPKPGLRGSRNNQYDFKMADGAGGAHLPEAPTICLHFLLSSTASVLMGCKLAVHLLALWPQGSSVCFTAVTFLDLWKSILILFVFFYYFYVHEYFACLYVWAYVPSEEKKELDLWGTVVTDCWEPPRGCWEPNPGLPQEVFLITKSPLQPNALRSWQLLRGERELVLNPWLEFYFTPMPVTHSSRTRCPMVIDFDGI